MINTLSKLSTSIHYIVNNTLNNLMGYCHICKFKLKKNNHYICSYCIRVFSVHKLNDYCIKCQWPISGSTDTVCDKCISNCSSFTKIIISYRYAKPIDQFIQNFKYSDDIAKGRVLSYLLLKQLEQFYYKKDNYKLLPEVIVPVPLHTSKFRTRGYNQSIEIAKYLSHNLAIPIDYSLVAKYKVTDSQMGLDKQTRSSNLRDSFCLNKRAYYESAVIIDDVVTTGSTINCIAELLSMTKIKNISVWALARAY